MDIPLENHLCFKLYVSSRLVVKLFTEPMAALGLTYPKYLVLAALSEQDHQTVTELGEKLHLDSGTLSPLLKSLLADKFIVRTRSVDDERIVSNSITEKGRGVRSQATKASYDIFCGTGVSFDALTALRVAMDDFIGKCQSVHLGKTDSLKATKLKLKTSKNRITDKNLRKTGKFRSIEKGSVNASFGRTSTVTVK